MRAARERRKWSANVLAARLQVLGVDLPPSSIYHIENGQRSVSDFELLAISRALGKDVAWLLEPGETGEP
ncbi:MAG: helix-turn-helix transcriptional regulator [Oscillospiraceae bacterium]|jgi:transcriptional regulator with XRE-family HTH domain|nr:helix-turn-helix transcriptional regulator [Oscillospiraceae bacterium]